MMEMGNIELLTGSMGEHLVVLFEDFVETLQKISYPLSRIELKTRE